MDNPCQIKVNLLLSHTLQALTSFSTPNIYYHCSNIIFELSKCANHAKRQLALKRKVLASRVNSEKRKVVRPDLSINTIGHCEQ